MRRTHSAFGRNEFSWFDTFFGSGRAAVVLFFVLSGYVLSLPCWNGREAPYPIYLVRRICPIYLPFAAAALSILGDLYFRRFHLNLSEWYALTWRSPVTLKLVLMQFTMWPIPQFNTAFWSLFFEMEMSLVMPLLYVVLRRYNAVAVTAMAYAVVFSGTWLLAFAGIDVGQHHMWANGLKTLQVACHFLLGVTLAKLSASIGELFRRMGRWVWLVLGGSLVAYWQLLFLPSMPMLQPLNRMVAHLTEYWNLPIGLGAAGIIVCSLHLRPVARTLEHALPEYLGRISYSVYLMHGIVLFSLVDLLYGKLPLPLPLLCLAIVAGSVALGHLFCVSVEEPSMRLGKRLATLLAQHARNRTNTIPANRTSPEMAG